MSNYHLRGVSVLSLIAQRPIISRKYLHECVSISPARSRTRFGGNSANSVWQHRSPGVKLFSVDICLYLSVSNNSCFARRVFFGPCHVASFSEGIVWYYCRVIRPLQQALQNTVTIYQRSVAGFYLALIPSTPLPETKDLHSAFINVILTKQCSAADECIRWKSLLDSLLLQKDQIRAIDLIAVMVIVRYKCVWKGIDSPKVWWNCVKNNALYRTQVMPSERMIREIGFKSYESFTFIHLTDAFWEPRPRVCFVCVCVGQYLARG